jgi:hypothetical protein
MTASCGGRYEVGNHPESAGGAGGSGGSTDATTTSVATGGAGGATTGAGGFAGAPIIPDPCVVTSMKACQAFGCHGGDSVSAGLRLDNYVLLQDFRQLIDRPNTGTQGVTQLGDLTGCPPRAFKLIDSDRPNQSLLWLKPRPSGSSEGPPCGGKMPVIGSFTQADKDCVQSWILSVIGAGSQ